RRRLSSITRAPCRKVVAAWHQKDAPAAGGVPGLQETFLSVLDRRSQSTHGLANLAKKIIELAKACERNVEVLCEAALNVPAGAVSAPNPPPLPASPPSKPDSSF